MRHRGRFCYISALLPGHREPTPILRLRYQGSADRWAIGIYLASTGQYTESELPASFGPKTGTPEEGVDDTFILYAGPKTGHLRPSARTRAQATKVRNTSETRSRSHHLNREQQHCSQWQPASKSVIPTGLDSRSPTMGGQPAASPTAPDSHN